MGDRVAVLKDGVLQQVDTPRNMYDNPSNVFVAGFIGSPAMNLLQVAVEGDTLQFGGADHADAARDRGRSPTRPGARSRSASGPRTWTSSAEGQGLKTTINLVEELGADAYVYGTRRGRRQGPRHHRPRRRPPAAGQGRDGALRAEAGPRAPVLHRVRRAARRPDAPPRRLAGHACHHGPADARRAERPGAARPALGRPARGLAGRPARRAAPRHLPPRRAVRAPRRGGVRGQGDRRERRPARVRPAASAGAARRARRRGGRRRLRPGGRRRPAARPGAASPGTCSSRCPTARCSPRRCARTPPTGCSTRCAALLVRLHTAGFYWGDCSFSNTLFRRDAGAFAAYLVDAETGELHGGLSDGQRAYDVDLARTNIAGELLDLDAGSLLHPSIDPVGIATRSSSATASCGRSCSAPRRSTPASATASTSGSAGSTTSASTSPSSPSSPTSTAAPCSSSRRSSTPGHHSRRLLRLTGLDVEENQARRLLNDLDAYRAAQNVQGEAEEIVAHRWVDRGLRPGRAGGAEGAARQAGAGRDLPRGARAPVVPVRARGPRRRADAGRAVLRRRRAERTSRTSRRCSGRASAPPRSRPTPSTRTSPDARSTAYARLVRRSADEPMTASGLRCHLAPASADKPTDRLRPTPAARCGVGW